MFLFIGITVSTRFGELSKHFTIKFVGKKSDACSQWYEVVNVCNLLAAVTISTSAALDLEESDIEGIYNLEPLDKHTLKQLK